MSNCTGPALAERDPVAATRTRHVAERHCAFERVHPLGCILGETEADVGAHLGAEVARAARSLIGAGAQQLVGPVGAQHDQRHPRVVGLHHGGPEVGHRGARRHRHTDRRALGDREPDRQDSRRCARRCGRAAGCRPARSASCSAKASGALREPGHSTTSRTPPRISSSTTTRACAVEGFTTTDYRRRISAPRR